MLSGFDKRLKSILIKHGLLDNERADSMVALAEKDDKGLTDILLNNRAVAESDILGVVGQEMNIPPVDLTRVEPSEEALECLPQDMARYYGILPIAKLGKIITMAVSNPFDILRLDDARIITGCDIRPVVSTVRSIEKAIAKAYDPNRNRMEQLIDDIRIQSGAEEIALTKAQDDEGVDLAQITESAQGSNVVKYVNLIIYQAIKRGASDIHIEPFEKDVRVRYRIDGNCTDAPAPPRKLHNAIVSRIKIMATLDIAEKRVPQDGKFQLRVEGRQVDFRVSILPVMHGEKAVMRILDVSNLALTLDDLGFEKKTLDDFRTSLKQPYGMILVTGPTGSGKSTTLYSAIKEVMTPAENIVTVEDPVEYEIHGVNQVAINPKRGLTFAAALRSILRQDPDTIMVGEIRDLETAEIAIKAALTGHLVLSTLHTNDACSTVSRMTDMGIEPFMVASSLLLVAAQRLGRKLCEHCKELLADPPPLPALLHIGFTEEEARTARLFQDKGCSKCFKGYRGRFAMLEALPIDDEVQRIILKGGSALDIRKYALETQGMISLRRAGLFNVMRGRTTIEEVLGTTKDEL